MMRINSSLSVQCQPIQNPKSLNTKNTFPAFGAGEAEFIKHLNEFCKSPSKWYHAEHAMAYAQSAAPNHPDILNAFERIKKDASIEESTKKWVLEELPKMIGISERKESPKTDTSQATGGIFGFFRGKKKAKI